MPSYISVDYWCPDCGLRTWDTVEREHKDRHIPCITKDCEGMLRRVPSAPKVMSVALPDGVKRGGGYQELKEAARLRVEAAELPPGEQRDRVNKEIQKLRSTKE